MNAFAGAMDPAAVVSMGRNLSSAARTSGERDAAVARLAAADASLASLRPQLEAATAARDAVAAELADAVKARDEAGARASSLAAEVASQLFQPFMTTKQQGMGVGLSISRTIIEAHGGRIWVESIPSGGTVFKFTLPVVKPEDLTDDE